MIVMLPESAMNMVARDYRASRLPGRLTGLGASLRLKPFSS